MSDQEIASGLEWTRLNGAHVIITEGGDVDRVGRVYGVFTRPEHARSEDADRLAVAIVGPDKLTQDQIAMARRNSERI